MGCAPIENPTWLGTHIHESFAYLKIGMEWASFDPETAPKWGVKGK